MTDAVANLMMAIQGLHNAGEWVIGRGNNILDSGAPFYGTYETSDGQYVAVGPIEPQFFAQFLECLGIPPAEMESRMDRQQWNAHRQLLEDVFRQRTRADWEAVFEGSDACVTPVLSLAEAPDHPHNVARGTYTRFGGAVQAAPAPRFSRTPGRLHTPPPKAGVDGFEVLRAAGLTELQISALVASGAFIPPLSTNDNRLETS
jgi:alpha-methylacyl-CoA racemase